VHAQHADQKPTDGQEHHYDHSQDPSARRALALETLTLLTTHGFKPFDVTSSDCGLFCARQGSLLDRFQAPCDVPFEGGKDMKIGFVQCTSVLSGASWVMHGFGYRDWLVVYFQPNKKRRGPRDGMSRYAGR